MKKISISILLLSSFLILSIGGCNFIGRHIVRWTTDFNTLSSDNRILYENGADKLAAEAALHLDKAIKDVESRQLGKFTEPVKIYVFATPEKFSKFTGISAKARGASFGNELYLSGLLKDLPQEVYGMIAHELSHVQLSQQLKFATRSLWYDSS